MPGLRDRLFDHFLKGPRLSLHFMMTPRALACLSWPGDARKAPAGRAVLPLPPDALAPAFDPPNIKNPGELGRLVREAVRQARGSGHEAALLLPEACQKGFVLNFEGFPASAAERRELILWRLKKMMPSLPEDARLSFDGLGNGSARRIFASLARASVIREYEGLFASSGLKLRSVGLPTLGLFNLLDRGKERDVILANIEEEAASLLVALDGEPVLYRYKPFLSGGSRAGGGALDGLLKEISGTLHYLEDREKRKVSSVWIRTGSEGNGAELAAALQDGTGLPVRLLEAPVGTGLKPRERQYLAPLFGMAA